MKIFVTGVSKGIGKALVEQLIQDGHEVWGVSRDEAPLHHERFHYKVCDLRDERAMEDVARDMRDASVYPEAVILNAGVEKSDTEHGFQYNVGKEMFETNYFGAMKWIDLFMRFPVAPKQCVAISSVFAFRPNDYSISYSASKSALVMAFRGIRLHVPRSKCLFKIVYLIAVNTTIKSSFEQYVSGKRSLPFFVLSPKTSARLIIDCLGKNKEYFYSHPRLSLIIRLTSFLSDRWFQKLTAPFRRK